ncbi:MAG: bifunctional folylpolyglutamate synthase/dihydrofolate synthase, partial [Hyphomonadaceae bacterium]
MRAIAARAGIDLATLSAGACVITGSNGKGSTAAMLASALSSAGKRTGLFTSPHLFEINERFRIDGADISDAALDRHWARLEEAADAWLAAHPGEALGGFEFLFLLAASWFSEAQCDGAIWEAGIGGRYDVTRLIHAPCAALVSLDLEHTSLLGDTLEEIAKDKIDVVAPGGFV